MTDRSSHLVFDRLVSEQAPRYINAARLLYIPQRARNTQISELRDHSGAIQLR